MPKILGAKWWELIGALVGVIGLVITLKNVFFSDIPAVLPEDPHYPPFSEQTVCVGDWLYQEYRFCEDNSKPIYEKITDPEICVVEKVKVQDVENQYKTCRHPSHGIAGYEKSEIYENWSGWRSGGYDQMSWCNQLLSSAQQKIGQPLEWEILERREQSEKDFLGRVSYKYFCKMEVQWEPIYHTAQSKACGLEQPKTDDVEIAKTCINPDSPIEYERSRRKQCGESLKIKPLSATDVSDLLTQIKNEEIAWYKCATCDDLIESPNEYAECLIASAYYYMEASSTAGMKIMKSKLVARKSNPKGLKNKTKKRVKHQLQNLKEAL